MASHSSLLVELGPICNSMAASLCLKSCEDHSLLKSYDGGLLKNNYRSGPIKRYQNLEVYAICKLTYNHNNFSISFSDGFLFQSAL